MISDPIKLRGFVHVCPLLLLAYAIILGACSSNGADIKEQLDSNTGVTVSYADVPFVFYRDRPGIAAFARNFVNMGPIRINRMGEHRYFLWFGIWSTVQNPDVVQKRDGFETVYLFVDGEPFELELIGWTVDSIGASEPIYSRPVSTAADAFYPINVDQARLIAQASALRLRTSGARPESYELWDNQVSAKRSLESFLRSVSF